MPITYFKNSKLNPKRQKKRKLRAEISELENEHATEKINKTKSWFFGKINKTDKHLVRPITKMRKGKIINN